MAATQRTAARPSEETMAGEYQQLLKRVRCFLPVNTATMANGYRSKIPSWKPGRSGARFTAVLPRAPADQPHTAEAAP